MPSFKMAKIVITSFFKTTLGLIVALQMIKENLQFRLFMSASLLSSLALSS
jgi:hypothetical protein